MTAAAQDAPTPAKGPRPLWWRILVWAVIVVVIGAVTRRTPLFQARDRSSTATSRAHDDGAAQPHPPLVRNVAHSL